MSRVGLVMLTILMLIPITGFYVSSNLYFEERQDVTVVGDVATMEQSDTRTLIAIGNCDAKVYNRGGVCSVIYNPTSIPRYVCNDWIAVWKYV